MNKAYKFRLYPNEKQQVLLAKTFGCTRFIYNQMLAERKDYYDKNKQDKSKLKNHKYKTEKQYKQEFDWMKEVDSISLQQSRINLETAYKNFFRNKKFGFPKFKSKHDFKSSFRTVLVGNNIKLENNLIKLPRLGLVKIKQHRDVVGKIKSATVSKSASDKYFISILVEYELEANYQKNINKTIGLDMSMDNFYVSNEGEKANHPRWYRKYQSKLKRQQQSLSRKIKGSKNRLKQKKKVAIIHETISNKRNDFIEKISRSLINRFDYIVLEDINLQNMQQCLKLGKSVSDLGFGTFRERLRQKAIEVGKEIIKIDKWFPSSKLCSNCGNKYSELKLKERIWTCDNCNITHDRDINAAINLKNKFLQDTVGITEFQACGEKSSGLQLVVSETVLSEAGSPCL
jgi:putative transposase